MGLLKRAMALIAAGGLLAASLAGISADEGGEEAVAARALQPTEVVADIPEGYDVLFPLEWGGGSLLHFKGRLATMGCMADVIWIYHNNEWQPYSQYSVPHNFPVNQRFLQRYEQYIPAGTAWADCYNMCEFFGNTQCTPFEETEAYRYGGIPQDTPCTDDFDVRVQEQVLPRIPKYPPTCIIRTIKPQFDRAGGRILTENADIPIITIYGAEPKNNEYRQVVFLKVEVHEICHTTQHWNWLQQLSTGKENSISYSPYFKESVYGREFIDLIGFVETSPNMWSIPSDSIYKDIYHLNPIELSAELCAMYLLDAMNEPSNYQYERYVRHSNRFIKLTQKRNFNVNKYLTPQVREWLEAYMILPEITE